MNSKLKFPIEPLFVLVEVSTICNQNCPTCMYKKSDRDDLMTIPYDNFKNSMLYTKEILKKDFKDCKIAFGTGNIFMIGIQLITKYLKIMSQTVYEKNFLKQYNTGKNNMMVEFASTLTQEQDYEQIIEVYKVLKELMPTATMVIEFVVNPLKEQLRTNVRKNITKLKQFIDKNNASIYIDCKIKGNEQFVKNYTINEFINILLEYEFKDMNLEYGNKNIELYNNGGISYEDYSNWVNTLMVEIDKKDLNLNLLTPTFIRSGYLLKYKNQEQNYQNYTSNMYVKKNGDVFLMVEALSASLMVINKKIYSKINDYFPKVSLKNKTENEIKSLANKLLVRMDKFQQKNIKFQKQNEICSKCTVNKICPSIIVRGLCEENNVKVSKGTCIFGVSLVEQKNKLLKGEPQNSEEDYY